MALPSDGMKRRLTDTPSAALWLGFAGVVPFVAGAGAAWLMTPQPAVLALSATVAYGAVILSFLGGVRWGLAAASYGGPPTSMHWVLSIVPALVGWAANLMALAPGLGLLTAAFALAYFADARAARDGLAPLWYGALRRPLSGLVVASLGLSLLAVSVRFSAASGG